jgi:MFS family permease
VGTSAGGFLMPLIAGALIARMGWRDALLCLGALGGLLLASAARFGVPARADLPAGSAAPQSFSWRGALRAPNFWLITVYMALIYGTNTALITHLPAFARDTGSAVGWSALIASVFALFSLLGKLVYSAVGDRLDVRAPLWLAGAMQAPALLLLLALPSYPVLLVAAAANGLGTGAVLPAWSALIARCFSGASFGRVLGFSRLFAQPVMSMSAVLAGWAHDATGSYQPAFQGFLAASLVVAVLPLLIRVPQRV